MKKKKNNKGFSLIELIIAIAILVILTGLLAPQFMKYIEKSRLAKDLQSLDSVYTAVQGTLADETAYAGLVTKYKPAGKEDKIKDGIPLKNILDEAGKTGADKDPFADELYMILGVKAEQISFESKVAKALKNSDIYVSIDDQMQVGVWYGTKPEYANDTDLKVDLKVGVVPATAYKTDSSTTPTAP